MSTRRSLRHSLPTLAIAVAAAMASFGVAAESAATSPVSIDEARLSPAALEQAALGGLLASAERMSGGRAVLVEIVDLRVTPASLAGVDLDGVGRLRIEQGEWIPLRFTAGYDLQQRELFGLRVLPISTRTTTNSTTLDGGTIERVNGQVASQILAEFPDQPVEIVFIDLQPTNDARGHVAFRGTGLVDFADEGAAPVQFSALMDRASGLVVSMDYQLDVAGAHGEAGAVETIAAR
jgi:hypothetical protein